VGGLGEEYADEAVQLSDLEDRLSHGRFHLAVLGQFKRGKSTLLNALLGHELLPTAIVPLTAIPTFIAFDTSLRARCVFREDKEAIDYAAASIEDLTTFLRQYVAEQDNPKNHLGVSYVEVFAPAPILVKGVILIDTPGIGSTYRHNTEATLNFLPQCDAAVFLFSADPPITEVEIEFLAHVRRKVPRLFFVLNKIDYLSDRERDEAVTFLRSVLVDRGGVDAETPIFCVSARQGLLARQTEDDQVWKASGVREVETHLVDFLSQEKAAALSDAVKRKARDVVANGLLRLRLALRSLQMPLGEMEERLVVFDTKLGEVETERLHSADLLAGDQKRTHQVLEEHAEHLRSQGRTFLQTVAQQACAERSDDDPNLDHIQARLAEVIPGYFEHQFGETSALFKEHVSNLLRPHQDRIDQLIASIRRTAAELFDIPYHAPESSGAFEMVQRPSWITHNWMVNLSPIPRGLTDKLLTAKMRATRIHRHVLAQIDALVTRNVENLRWATYKSIDQTFWRFSATLDDRLAHTIAATHGAIHAALERREHHAQLIEKEIERLGSAERELAGIITTLEGG